MSKEVKHNSTELEANFASNLEIVRPFLSDDLVGEEQFKLLKDVAQDLPSASLGCIEAWFKNESSRVDLNFCAEAFFREHENLLGWASTARAGRIH